MFNAFFIPGKKIDRFKLDDLVVSTIAPSDNSGYETAVSHPNYDRGHFIVVEEYSTIEAAKEGHERWVKTMTTLPLPESLVDVGTNMIATLATILGADPKSPYEEQDPFAEFFGDDWNDEGDNTHDSSR